MGIQGVRTKHTLTQISQAIVNSQGIVQNALVELGCWEDYFYTKLKQHPELKYLLDQVRNERKGTLVKKSQNLLEWTLDMKEEMPGIAQKSAIYILDNQAKDIGYNKPEPKESIQVSDDVKEAATALLEQVSKAQSARKMDDSKSKADDKSK